MFLTLLPLRLVWFQFFFLLIAIALEAFVLQKQLNFGRKKSVFYAASINLISTSLGWILFFLTIPLLPGNLEPQLISYIFFDKIFLENETNPIYTEIWFTLSAVAIFFVSLTIKLRSFQLLQMWLYPQQLLDEAMRDRPGLGLTARSFSWADKAKAVLNILLIGLPIKPKKTLLKQKGNTPNILLLSRRKALAILWGHAASNSVILGILFSRNIILNYRERISKLPD